MREAQGLPLEVQGCGKGLGGGRGNPENASCSYQFRVKVTPATWENSSLR